MRERSFSRPRHALVARILDRLDAGFLADAQCFFGGGTRLVLALHEYRESADIDFLCSSRDGYRLLRSGIGADSLGRIALQPLRLAREVVADRYGIRTFIEIGGEKIKFEVVNEGRIDLSGTREPQVAVPCLDRASCFAEKLLANDDRWTDESTFNRDIVDLAFMLEGWGTGPLLAGVRIARAAYGDSVVRSARSAARRLSENRVSLKQCVEGLRVTDLATLKAGLKVLAQRRWPSRSPSDGD